MMDNIGHEGIYLGSGYFLHDSPNSSTGGVGVNQLSDVRPNTNTTWKQLTDNVNRRIVE